MPSSASTAPTRRGAATRAGSGLGLSIVEATVRAHGGTTTLRTAPGAGTTVRVELPLHAPLVAAPPFTR